jgi:hypothetical protein
LTLGIRDVDGVGVHRAHFLDGEKAHARYRDEQKRHQRDDFRTDREFGEHE